MKIKSIEILTETDKQVLFKVKYKSLFGFEREGEFLISTMVVHKRQVYNKQGTHFVNFDTTDAVRSYADLNKLRAITKFTSFMDRH